VRGPWDLEPGTLFAGDYRIAKKLGEGGMGAVYEAQQVSTGRRRALKLMLPELVAKPDVRRRFETEARIGARIESDHVVDVIAAGVDEATGTPWLAMELLEGEPLDQYADRRGRLSTAEVREILDQLCHALGEAHRHGIVHRDLKPENIFITRPRRKGPPFTVKILDFGIAKITADAKTTSSKTAGMIGSALWMAPEQADEGGLVGPATDVWALGLIAFRLLTGRCFWKAARAEGNTLVIFIKEAFVSPTPAASARAEEFGCADQLPEGFDGWFARCVNHLRTARFADAAEAYAKLEPLLGGPANAMPPSTSANLPWPASSGGSGTQFDAVSRSAPTLSRPVTRRSLLRPARLPAGAVGLAVLLGGLVGSLGPRAVRELAGNAGTNRIAVAAPGAGSVVAVADVAEVVVADAAAEVVDATAAGDGGAGEAPREVMPAAAPATAAPATVTAAAAPAHTAPPAVQKAVPPPPPPTPPPEDDPYN
jgi:eukaryotic-like serine/threonine-protein kinase